MKAVLPIILAVLSFLTASVLAQNPGELNAGSQVVYSGSTGTYSLSWWGAEGNTYLIETSDDLVNWTYLPIVETGSNAVIQWGFTSTSSSLFLKLEFITSPTNLVYGHQFTGPDNNGDGLPDDWELFYFGSLDVNPNATVSWSTSLTNLQAYQQGINPKDFYGSAAPGLTDVSLSSLSSTLGDSSTVSMKVTGSNGLLIPGGPVIFTIDYGLLVSPGASASSASQTLEVAANSSGVATVDVITPIWPDIPFTVTAIAPASGSPVPVVKYGETGGDIPSAPDAPDIKLPTPVSEPTLSVELTSTSVANPAFEQFQPSGPPVKWYLISTSTGSLTFNDVGSAGIQGWAGDGSYSRIGVVHRPFTGTTWTGSSEYSDTYYDVSGGGTDPDGGDTNTGVYPAADDPNSWSNTYTSWGIALTDAGGSNSGPEDVSGPPFGPGDYADWNLFSPYATILSQSTTETSSAYLYSDESGNETDFSDSTTLSNEYTSQQFQADVLSVAPSTAAWDDTDYDIGDTLAWNELADDVSSYSVGLSSYKFKCATTGSTPYVFDWYEVFQPDDDTQPIQVTPKEWDNANQQSESPVYQVGPSAGGSSGTNGTWFLARLDTTTVARFPECQWRHKIGIGETANINLEGMPTDLSGSATWSYSPSDAGTLTNADVIGGPLTGASVTFVAARKGEAVTISCSVGGATLSTTLTIETPTGVTHQWFASGSTSYPTDKSGAVMFCLTTVLPTDVSFGNCSDAERPVLASNVSGYFKTMNIAPEHNPNNASKPPAFLTPADNINGYTWISIREDNTELHLDTIGSPSFVFIGPGSYEWDIPMAYELQGDTDNGVSFPNKTIQTESTDSNGITTETKDNAWETRSPSGIELHSPAN